MFEEEEIAAGAHQSKMNTYLKETADACNITKKMTFHTARHTFATTVTLTNGFRIETVSKMLGHRNLKTTLPVHSAKVLMIGYTVLRWLRSCSRWIACAKWLVYESGLDLRNFEFKVHSANPAAAKETRGLPTNYMKHQKAEL